MRISDWSSDVCSSDLLEQLVEGGPLDIALGAAAQLRLQRGVEVRARGFALHPALRIQPRQLVAVALVAIVADAVDHAHRDRKSVVMGKSGSVRVDLGGRRLINKKKKRERQDT